ncbi:1-deoxy-D-xylulose-5-phosphate reductoisomerase [Collinsella tanakaei]|uniref:1-deoxy-D-xylulose-5-phosphate reductoisomerase n=1 Tax=Collinsella tanakaei TaxID=626935 RepID=UPI0019572558|nr:1-deoxy-D-xylulose-5-phosphate reductoisomerase [Collinsella tanakaei]MBM6867542.1 1-deoxy-D-xylulose-5-phosphate reductoisomerase [Collinsella tanakaei]
MSVLAPSHPLGAPAGRLRVAILGCTGSIGTQALDVCRQHADRLEVVALTAHARTAELVAAAREFGVARVGVTDPAHAHDAALADLPEHTTCLIGPDAAVELACAEDVDCVLVAIVGAAGLAASAAVLETDKRLALANKESLVVGGDLLMPRVRPGQLIPVDSEHAAIFQCYQGESAAQAHAIWLTCSGGPFFGRTREDLSRVTPAEALAHPTWNMGAKITIDSATLMNKGLERIEAMHLFGVDMEFIRIVIQRQSKIHSMVEYDDGSVIAHLGASDMRIPIQYAFSYPDRWSTPAPRVDFRTLGSLDFAAPDAETFRCLALAEQAGRTRGTLPCVMNAANEVAVSAFLAGACSFTDIDAIVERCMDAHTVEPVQSLEQLADVDAWARRTAEHMLAAR